VLLAAGFAVRLLLALTDDGLYWPDEVYQSLEPAHRLVFGYGLVAWEFVEGARSWALPGLLAGLLQLGVWLGLAAPRGYLALTEAAFCLAGVATAAGAWRLARAHGASEAGALAAAALFALPAPALYFAPRAMSETASALPLVWGFALCLAPEAAAPGGSAWRRRLGASLLGLSVLLRLHAAVLCAVLLGQLLWRGLAAARGGAAGSGAARGGAAGSGAAGGGASGGPLPLAVALRPAAEVGAVLLLWALVFGALDRLTWGGWFHSAQVYWRFNVVEGKAAQWGVAPFAYYAVHLWRSAPLPVLCLGLLGLAGARRSAGLLVAAAAFLLLHSFVPHKELRFVLPALPLLAAAAGVGVDALAGGEARARWALAGAVLVAGALSAAQAPRLTFGQLGAYGPERARVSAWDDSGDVNRLLLAAHREADLCGLKVEAVHLAWTGGHSTLHRPVPLYPHTGPGRASGHFNYVITSQPGAGAEVRAREGGLVLARLAPACTPDPGYAWRLP
jgi:hypothetical protein